METTIYKKDSKGNIRFLTIHTEDNFVVQTSGIYGTDNPVENRSACVAKNVGRSNETTPEHQATLEAFSKIEEKMRQGYFLTIDEADEKGGKDFLLPMLAKDFKKEVKKVKFPCYAQPKLDGMRSLGEKSAFMSRTGKVIETINHIKFDHIDEILDGELYAHGESFQAVMRMVKKVRPETLNIMYHVYDVVMPVPFEQRWVWMVENLGSIPGISLVETVVIESIEELQDYHRTNIERGYEGTMVRHSEEHYAVNKRSSQLLKYKDFLDEVYKVIDVIPSESRPEQGIVVCQNDKGDTFGCGMKFSHAEREDILKNKTDYLGKMAEIRFFEFSESGIPRFPVCYGFRLDK